jgi:ABC-type transport system substrate-binding protein
MDFTWKLWGNPKFGAIQTVNNLNIASADVSSDNLTITFHLKNPQVSFVANWVDGYYAPMPAHIYSSMDPASILKSSNNLNPQVVSGPFMMSEAKPNDHYGRVKQLWAASPYLIRLLYHHQNTILTESGISLCNFPM